MVSKPKTTDSQDINSMSAHAVQGQSKRRVLFVNRSYWPDSEATGQLLTELCEAFADEFDVHVLAGQPNASSEESWQDQKIKNGVTIHRVTHTVWPKSNMLLKSINFLSFARACRQQILSIPVPDIVVFETDPFLLPFVADRLRQKKGVPMIGYLQDIYPDVAVALGKIPNSWWVRKLRQKMFDVYKRCRRMVVLSTDMRRLLLESGIEADRIRIVRNWADTEKIHPVSRSQNRFLQRENLQDKFVVMYSGNLGLTQRLEEFIEAANLLRDEQKVAFVFIGRGAMKARLEKQANDLNLENVRFLDYQPKEELAHSLSAADLHLVPLTKELSACLMPSKLYGILAAGRPFLTNSPVDSELHRITTEQGVGFTCRAGSSQAIAESILQVVRDPEAQKLAGERALTLSNNTYTKSHSIQHFRDVLNEALGEV